MSYSSRFGYKSTRFAASARRSTKRYLSKFARIKRQRQAYQRLEAVSLKYFYRIPKPYRIVILRRLQRGMLNTRGQAIRKR